MSYYGGGGARAFPAKPIVSYLPIQVLKHIEKSAETAENLGEPLIKHLKTPAYTPLHGVTIFADVSGFTNLTESLSNMYNSPTSFLGSDLLAVNLNFYMSQILRTMETYNCDIIKFAGDSLVAIIPYEFEEEEKASVEDLRHHTSSLFRLTRNKRSVKQIDSMENDEKAQDAMYHAINCALVLQTGELTKQCPVNRGRHASNGTRSRMKQTETELLLKVKLGLGIGEIGITHIGGASDRVLSRRIEYVAIGDALQQAFDCEHLCQPGDIHISKQAGQVLNAYLERNKIKKTVDFSLKSLPKHGGNFKVRCKKANIKNMYVLTKEYDFNRVKEEILWSYVPLTAKPYLRNASQEMWVNEFRKVTTLFCQLGFDKSTLQGMISRKENDLAFFDRVFKEVQNCVFKYEGQINKFLVDDKGNTLLVVFGLSPFAHENDEARAVLCGDGIINILQKHKLWRSVGISTGMVYCGLFGARNRKELTVLGDSVNIAARLMKKVEDDHLFTGQEYGNDDGSGSKKFLRKKVTLKIPQRMKDYNKPGPMYIDLPTRSGLLRFEVPIQFEERSEPLVLKGKSETLRAFSINMMLTGLARFNNGLYVILCQTSTGMKIVQASKKDKFKDIKPQILIKSGAKPSEIVILWHKYPGLGEDNRGVPVHDEESLAQLASEANSTSMLHFSVQKKDSDQNSSKASLDTNLSREAAPIKNVRYQHDLQTLKRPRDWPERIIKVLEDDKVILKRERSIKAEMNVVARATIMNPEKGIWYECEDSLSVIKRLEDFETNIHNELQIIGLEGTYGVGKSFAVNHVFNKNNYNIGASALNLHEMSPLVLNVKANEFTSADDGLFTEMFALLKEACQIFEEAEHKRIIHQPAEKKEFRQNVLEESFKLGVQAFDKNNKKSIPIRYRPDQSKLYLLNEFLDTGFKSPSGSKYETFETGEDGEEILVACKKDMTRIFMLDDSLTSVVDKHNLDQSFATKGVLSVESLSSIICALFTGMSLKAKKPIISVIENGHFMGPFSWVVLLELAKFWKDSKLTFVIPIRALSTMDNLGTDAIALSAHDEIPSESKFNFPMDAKEMTRTLLKGMHDEVDKAQQKIFTQSKSSMADESLRITPNVGRHSVRQMYRNYHFSTNIQLLLKEETKDKDALPYPLANKQVDIHYLQIRLREFLCTRFIEVRSRKEHTKKIARNILEVNEFPSELVEILAKRTNGNPTYIRETLLFLRENKLLEINEVGDATVASFNAPEFQPRALEVPIMIESFCSMIYDQFDLFGQTILKTAAFYVHKCRELQSAKPLHFTKRTVFQLMRNIFKEAVNLEASWGALICSEIIAVADDVDLSQYANPDLIPCYFMEEWMPICVFRKLTDAQKSAIEEAYKLIRESHNAKRRR